MKTLPLVIGLLLVLTVVACGAAATPLPTQPPPTSPPPTQSPPTTTPGVIGVPLQSNPFVPSGSWQPNVSYCTAGDQALSMDLYYPAPFRHDPAPAAIYIQPGGKDVPFLDFETLREIVKRGYFVIAPRWREDTVVNVPQDLADIKCAVRYLRKKASAYHIDPMRIAAWGCSDGGYLANMLALTGPGAGFEGNGQFADQSSGVQAAAPRDGWAFFRYDDPKFASISPLSYVSKNAPPFLVISSDGDPMGVAAMGQLYDALAKAGVSVTRVVVVGTGHCGENGRPTPADLTKMTADFFDAALK
jgi:acetyl esterase/lipase